MNNERLIMGNERLIFNFQLKRLRSVFLIPVFMMLFFAAEANNVRVVQDIEIGDEFPDNIATVSFKIAWDNSWRDDFNWDAVYVFLKYKKKDEAEWKHAYLMDNGHALTSGFGYQMAKTGTLHRAMGMFVERNTKGSGDVTVSLSLKWRIDQNSLVSTDFLNDLVELQATCIEMVYYPQGAFCLGDGYSDGSFRTNFRPILPEWDVIKNDGTMTFSSSDDPTSANYKAYPPSNAANRVNENINNNIENAWVANAAGAVSWIVDFGADESKWKKILYFGVSGVANRAGNRPKTWNFKGRRSKDEDWQLLWSGTDEFWVIENNSYPVQQALGVNREKAAKYRYYMVEVVTSSAPVYANNIAMTEVDMATLTNDAYVMDKASGVEMDMKTKLSANDNDTWSGTLQANYPTGFNGFYAMKYEVTQEQWVHFLNKLQYKQQKSRTIGFRLDELVVGNYVYGDKNTPTCRNGIAVGARVDGNVVFVNDLNKNNPYAQSDDGQNIACNYLSPADMLAYADWCGLRPLSEMEYEKMARSPYPAIPGQGEWAGGVKNLMVKPGVGSISGAGTKDEKVNNNEGKKVNINAGATLEGPVRVGSLAVGGAASQESTGAGFWGAMDLSGNLAEIYYNCTLNQGRAFQDVLAAHGDGMIRANSDNTEPGGTDVKATFWPQTPGAFILKGGHFKSADKRVAISDRSANGYFSSINAKDSLTTFRIGRSFTKLEGNTNPETFIYLNNGKVSTTDAMADTVCAGGSYTLRATPVSAISTSTGGQHSFIWYKSENNGLTWDIIRGEEGPNLTYANFNNDGGLPKAIRFKRKTIATSWWSETKYVELHIVNTSFEFNRLKDTITKANHVLGYWVDTKTKASYTWKWKSTQGNVIVRAGQKNEVWDFYAPLRRDFDYSKKTEDEIIICEINFLGRCIRNQELKLNIAQRPTTGVSSSLIAINAANPANECGAMLEDKRSTIRSEVYATVKIGDQCWMAENLRYDLKGYTMYRSEDPSGEILGGFYAGGRETQNKACPDGWGVPTIAEYNQLIAYLNNIDGTNRAGAKMKQGAFWHVDLSQKANIGTNESGFGLVGTGYYRAAEGGWVGLSKKDDFNHYYFSATYFGTTPNNNSYFGQGWNSSTMGYTSGSTPFNYSWGQRKDGYDGNGNKYDYTGNYNYRGPLLRGWQYWGYYFPIRCIKR